MNPIYILRFLRGFVVFEIKGGFTERFINLCAANKINIWDVNLHGNSLTAAILIKNFKLLRPVVKKSGCKLKILKKVGVPPFLFKNKNRIGLLVSICFCVAFFTVMNQFVWIIDVEGTNTVSHQEITELLENYGLKQGAFASSLDTVDISRKAVNHFNGRLLWMAINIKGSKATVEVRDYIDEHENKEFKEPCNIIADFNGLLLSVEVNNGDQEVWEGNAVKKGDLLISGVIDYDDLSAGYYEARGKITALHDVRYTEEYSYKKTDLQYIDIQKKHFSLHIFGLEIPLGLNIDHESSTVFSYNKMLQCDGYKLPFGFSRETVCTKAERKDADEAEYLLALDSYTASFYEKFKNTNILSCNSYFQKNAEKYIISSELYCIDFMGVKSPILTEFYEN